MRLEVRALESCARLKVCVYVYVYVCKYVCVCVGECMRIVVGWGVGFRAIRAGASGSTLLVAARSKWQGAAVFGAGTILGFAIVLTFFFYARAPKNPPLLSSFHSAKLSSHKSVCTIGNPAGFKMRMLNTTARLIFRYTNHSLTKWGEMAGGQYTCCVFIL